MIIEFTILTDEGKPFIMDGVESKLVFQDGGDRLEFNSKVIGNKVINYFEMPSDKESKK